MIVAADVMIGEHEPAFLDYGNFEAKASSFRTGMKPTNSIQPTATAQTGFQRIL